MSKKIRWNITDYGRRMSLTWGVMPSKTDFFAHFDRHVLGHYYLIRNDRRGKGYPGYDGDYTKFQLFTLVKRLSRSSNDRKRDTASAILDTLGIEWI